MEDRNSYRTPKRRDMGATKEQVVEALQNSSMIEVINYGNETAVRRRGKKELPVLQRQSGVGYLAKSACTAKQSKKWSDQAGMSQQIHHHGSWTSVPNWI